MILYYIIILSARCTECCMQCELEWHNCIEITARHGETSHDNYTMYYAGTDHLDPF